MGFILNLVKYLIIEIGRLKLELLKYIRDF